MGKTYYYNGNYIQGRFKSNTGIIPTSRYFKFMGDISNRYLITKDIGNILLDMNSVSIKLYCIKGTGIKNQYNSNGDIGNTNGGKLVIQLLDNTSTLIKENLIINTNSITTDWYKYEYTFNTNEIQNCKYIKFLQKDISDNSCNFGIKYIQIKTNAWVSTPAPNQNNATAEAIITNGIVTGINITDYGTGYYNTPIIEIVAGNNDNGYGAKAYATTESTLEERIEKSMLLKQRPLIYNTNNNSDDGCSIILKHCDGDFHENGAKDIIIDTPNFKL